MAFLDTALVVIIILFIILLIWSRVMGQRIIDSLYEIKEFIASFKEKE